MKLKAISLSRLFVFLVFSTTMFSSCKKDSPSGATAQLSATVGSTSFQPSVVTGLDISGHIIVGGIQIVSGDTLGLTISIPDTVKAGSVVKLDYSADDLITFSHSKTQIGYDTYEDFAHASITVSGFDKANKKVSGSFTGVLYNADGLNKDSVKINGSFNSAYLTY